MVIVLGNGILECSLYISAKRKGIHITKLTITIHFLSKACDLVFDATSMGKSFLIIGTKNKVVDSVASTTIKGSMSLC